MKIEVGDFHLSPYRLDDVGALVEHLADGIVGLTIPVLPFPYGESEAQSFLTSRVGELAGAPVRAFAIRLASGRLCGGVGLDPAAPGADAELGYWLAPSLWGQRVMSSVVPAFLAYAADLDIGSITARAFTTNLGSLRLLRSNGFRSLGVHTGAAATRSGSPQDLELFRLDLEHAAT